MIIDYYNNLNEELIFITLISIHFTITQLLAIEIGYIWSLILLFRVAAYPYANINLMLLSFAAKSHNEISAKRMQLFFALYFYIYSKWNQE